MITWKRSAKKETRDSRKIGYSEADLKIIRWKRPDLKIQRPEKYSLDQIIIEFLKKYEVYVKPVTSKTRRIGQDALSGVLTDAFGADVGGDAFQISGQNKQTQVQEWTQWKQWALEHKDFEAFRNGMNSKIDEENEKITDYLESAEFKKVADQILAKNKKWRSTVKNRMKRLDNFLVVFLLLPSVYYLVQCGLITETKKT